MNNKDGKTFTDLIFDSSMGSNDDNKKISFGEIYNDSVDSQVENVNSSVEDIKDTVDTSVSSFNSIFEEVKDNKKLDDSSDNKEVAEEKKDAPTSEKVESEDSNFFFEESKDVSEEKEDAPTSKKVESEDSNFFFEENKDVSEEKEDVPTSEKLESEDSNFFFEENKEVAEEKEDAPTSEKVESEGSNFFFEENKEVAEEKEDVPTSEKVESEDNNFFFEESKDVSEEKDDTPTSEKVESEDSNFFFEESKDVSEEKDDTPTSEKVESEDSNFFFEENKEVAEEKEEVIESKEEQVNQNIDVDGKDEKLVSDSPFFSDSSDNSNSVQEENPLFLNTLNLVEERNKKEVSAIDSTKSKHFNVKVVKKKEPLIKVIIGVISYAIFIWLLLVGITLLIYVLDIKIRQSKGDFSSPTYNAYVVLTGSMLPDIQVYDVVVTKKTDPSELDVKDIITFSSADTRFLGTTITHRIIRKNYNAETKTYTFQTKGDNNNVADSALVPGSNIYGKVILKIPKLGYLQEFLAADGGWIIVILIPCLAVISYDIVKLIKGLKKKKYKNIKVQK